MVEGNKNYDWLFAVNIKQEIIIMGNNTFRIISIICMLWIIERWWSRRKWLKEVERKILCNIDTDMDSYINKNKLKELFNDKGVLVCAGLMIYKSWELFGRKEEIPSHLYLKMYRLFMDKIFGGKNSEDYDLHNLSADGMDKVTSKHRDLLDHFDCFVCSRL